MSLITVFQQEYDAEVAASQLSTLERDELIPPSTSRLSSLAFGRRIAQAGRRGRGTQRFELSSDEVTSSFEYTTAEDDEEVLQRRQMREEQDEEVAAIFSRAAPTADIRPEGQRGRGGRQHPRRIPFERTRLLGITRPTAALRNGPEIHSSSDTEGPATESTDNLNFLQQLTAPRRRFGGRPLPPRPVDRWCYMKEIVSYNCELLLGWVCAQWWWKFWKLTTSSGSLCQTQPLPKFSGHAGPALCPLRTSSFLN